MAVNMLPLLMRFVVVRLCRQHPITSMLMRTKTVPEAMPTNNKVPDRVPDRMPAVGVLLVVGVPPKDEAGCPVGRASGRVYNFEFRQTKQYGNWEGIKV